MSVPTDGYSIIDTFSGEHRFLSNFWPAAVVLDGATYPTVEHAFQAAKTNSISDRTMIYGATSPGMAKRLGRNVELRDDWYAIRDQVMLDLVRQKFRPGTMLADQLLATGDVILVEGNKWNDTYWGVCNGQGENRLGRILMQVRAEIREGAS